MRRPWTLLGISVFRFVCRYTKLIKCSGQLSFNFSCLSCGVINCMFPLNIFSISSIPIASNFHVDTFPFPINPKKVFLENIKCWCVLTLQQKCRNHKGEVFPVELRLSRMHSAISSILISLNTHFHTGREGGANTDNCYSLLHMSKPHLSVFRQGCEGRVFFMLLRDTYLQSAVEQFVWEKIESEFWYEQ